MSPQLKLLRRGITQIGKADIHLVVEGVGQGYGNGESEHSVGEAEPIDIAVAAEDFSERQPHQRGTHQQHPIWKVESAEQERGGEHSFGAAPQQTLKADEEK